LKFFAIFLNNPMNITEYYIKIVNDRFRKHDL
jgi:hypothetical protein